MDTTKIVVLTLALGLPILLLGMGSAYADSQGTGNQYQSMPNTYLTNPRYGGTKRRHTNTKKHTRRR
jgi:hypothetical protein